MVHTPFDLRHAAPQNTPHAPQTTGEDFSTVVKSGTLTISGQPPLIEVRTEPLVLW